MKISKTEKIWLLAVFFLYSAYNIPGLPCLGDAKGLLIHGALTIVPLWIVVYVGMRAVNKVYQLKDENTDDIEG